MIRRMIIIAGLTGWILGSGVLTTRPEEASSVPLHLIRLPRGFQITLFAEHVPNARQMAWSPKGIVYVGTLRAGKVYAVVDHNRDGRAERVVTIAQGLNMPNGVAYRNGNLYVAEVARILRFDDIDRRLDDPPQPVVIRDDFPTDRHHGWKYIRFGPDGWLYVPVGAPCNICAPPPPYAAIHRMSPDGHRLETVAWGVRNTVGFDWHPKTGELWFTDNGRDWLGDDRPPDELNRLRKFGLHFGYPYCHGRDIADPEYGKKRPCSEFEPPAQELGPHVAAIGMKFYTGKMFPPEYRGQIFIAEHGSWNRSVPIGYRITLVRLEDSKPVAYEVFAEGWLQESGPWGRPVDILILPDGSMLVSDDFAGVIYRIVYRP